MLSKSSTYAIRGVLYLAIHSNHDRKFTAKKIAEEIDIPAPFLAKNLQELARHHLISSIKGRHGGFFLTEKDRKNSLLAIVACIEGIDKFYECVLGLSECTDRNPCPIHYTVSPARKALLEELSSKSINDFAKEIKEGKTQISL